MDLRSVKEIKAKINSCIHNHIDDYWEGFIGGLMDIYLPIHKEYPALTVEEMWQIIKKEGKRRFWDNGVYIQTEEYMKGYDDALNWVNKEEVEFT